jgi:regulation of enolase protein 1 (concanavalin A-like superfamily)
MLLVLVLLSINSSYAFEEVIATHYHKQFTENQQNFYISKDLVNTLYPQIINQNYYKNLYQQAGIWSSEQEGIWIKSNLLRSINVI